MHTFTLLPAYGRDYASRAALLTDYHAGKDFILRTWDRPDTYINAAQIPAGSRVEFRYGKLRKVAVITTARALSSEPRAIACAVCGTPLQVWGNAPSTCYRHTR